MRCLGFVMAAWFAVVAAAQDFPRVRDVATVDESGSHVTTIGDVDGDGTADVVLREFMDFDIYSGATGLGIHSIVLPAGVSTAFGNILRRVDDRNGDGVDDILTSDQFFNLSRGALFLISGATGSEIARIVGGQVGGQFGADFDLVEDLDGDLFREVLVGSPGAGLVGRADIVGSVSGSLLNSFVGTSAGEQFGAYVASIDDIDGDGRDDVLIGSIGSPFSSTFVESAVAMSSLTGLIIHRFSLPSPNERLLGLSRIQDVNGDSIDDMLLQYRISAAGTRAVIYGDSGHELGRLDDPGLICPVGDLNGDGVNDLAASGGGARFRFVAYSGVDLCPLIELTDPLSFLSSASFSPMPDSNGDGFDEVVLGRQGLLGPGIITAAGRGRYGVGTTLTLDWSSSTSNQALDGNLILHGGTPSGQTTLVASLGPAELTTGGLTVLVDVIGEPFTSLVVPLDPAGQFVVPFSLDSPAAAGLSVFLQSFEFTGAAFEASNGVEIVLSRREPPPIVDEIAPHWIVPIAVNIQNVTVRGRCFSTGIQADLNGVPLFVQPQADGSLLLSDPTFTATTAVDSELTLTNPGGTSTTVPFNPSPLISRFLVTGFGFLPTTGGGRVIIQGNYFFPGLAVTIDGVGIPLTVSKVDELEFISPPLPTVGIRTLTITSPNGATTSHPVTVVQVSPKIFSASPRSAGPGELVHVNGQYFDPGLTLDVGGQAVTPITVNPFQGFLTYIQPAGLGCDETLTLTNPDGMTASLTINPSPVMTSYTAYGPAAGGNLVEIFGQLDTLNGTTITLGGVPVQYFVIDDQLGFFAPPHAPGFVDLVIDNGVGCSLTALYFYM